MVDAFPFASLRELVAQEYAWLKPWHRFHCFILGDGRPEPDKCARRNTTAWKLNSKSFGVCADTVFMSPSKTKHCNTSSDKWPKAAWETGCYTTSSVGVSHCSHKCFSNRVGPGLSWLRVVPRNTQQSRCSAELWCVVRVQQSEK